METGINPLLQPLPSVLGVWKQQTLSLAIFSRKQQPALKEPSPAPGLDMCVGTSSLKPQRELGVARREH